MTDVTVRRPTRALSICAALCAALVWPLPGGADDGDDVRRTGTCSGSSTVELRLRGDDDEIRVELEIGGSRPGSAWKVILLHERRIAYRGTLRATGGGRARLRRELPDWYGSDAVTVRATGPRSQSCRVSATLR